MPGSISEASTQPPNDQPAGSQQKLVRLSSQSSMLMIGDDTFPRSRDDVLPRLLNSGWRIASVMAGSDGTGYAVLTK